ncbi:MAG: phosphoribosylformylglycinamidine synthase subunit PurQ [Rhodobiaceae bacterium]|jgi:phosphoribosylformylglycinamidine synthase I|nr:phosphoribosylformylglycinamidine synthase subunit PurQ [Rhodobiaceae bacterium]MBT7279588.1 phosphoribosylformylglycinamidine synthase subunit PurQ [Rhodobiaceae bacterium]
MQAAVIVFPGSNCDRDVAVCLEAATGQAPLMAWHGDANLPKCDLIVLPGGFSYGDYLRCGAMAANSPILREVVAQAHKGAAVLGICNGFQVLTECGLLPGVLMQNKGLNFVCRNTQLTIANNKTAFTSLYGAGEEITIPVAHNEGNYFADDDTLKQLQDEDRIALTYAKGDNPNGACLDIAGISDTSGRIVGMMPHPERRAEAALGGDDGKRMFTGVVEMLS